MKVELRRIAGDVNLEATNADGLTVRADGSPAIGGINGGMRPMEMLLASVGSCSAIDIVLLLKKQRQELLDIRITVSGERRDQEPRIFTGIHVHYELVGPIDERKAERACRLSMEKLCSVSMMLKAGGVEISWGYAVVNE